MKKYQAKEAKNIPILRQGRITRVHAELAKLQPGELITIEKGIDWKSKTPPYTLIRRFAAKHGWKFLSGRSADNTGWNVKQLS